MDMAYVNYFCMIFLTEKRKIANIVTAGLWTGAMCFCAADIEVRSCGRYIVGTSWNVGAAGVRDTARTERNGAASTSPIPDTRSSRSSTVPEATRSSRSRRKATCRRPQTRVQSTVRWVQWTLLDVLLWILTLTLGWSWDDFDSFPTFPVEVISSFSIQLRVCRHAV